MTEKINHPVYLSIRLALKHIIRILLKFSGFRVINRNFLPKKKSGVILIANHAAFIDSVYIIAALRPRFTICGAKPKYFEKPVLRELFRVANILRVENREQFLRDCTALLNKQENILIYPEMGRNGKAMGEFKTWAAEVALSAGVAAIPLYLYGTTEGQDGAITLIAGEPVAAAGTPEQLTELYKQSIGALQPEGIQADRTA